MRTNLRANLVLIFLFLFTTIIVGRLYYIQISQGSFYSALAQGQQGFFATTKGERGEVFFRYGEPLALNRTFVYLFASPRKIENPEEIAIKLKEILGLEKDFILKRLTRERNHFELLKRRLSQDKIDKLKEENLEGIFFGKEVKRYYPQNFLAAQIIGFVDGEGRGQYGIEAYHNKSLQYKEGFQKGVRDVWGRLLDEVIKTGGQDGSDIILTVNYNIQFKAEQLLKQAYEDFSIKTGQIIVLDPISGEILAMANFPSFNPNEFSQFHNLGLFQNPAIQKVFEPGSVMKTFTKAIALEKGKITPDTIYKDIGKVRIGQHTIRNFDHRVWGERTMTEILAKSINTGSVYAARLVGVEDFIKYLERFGFFDLTGIELQGEIAFHNNELRKGREINLATASFGHGIGVTSVQLVRAFAAIANQGRSVNLSIVKNNKRVMPITQQIISPQTAHQLTTMLIETVNHRFNRRAQVPGYYVAGKTGTAEISWAALGYDKPGYSDKLIHTFIGFAPAYNPQFLIMVKLNQPEGVRTASVSVAPIFRDLSKHIISLWQIPPDY